MTYEIYRVAWDSEPSASGTPHVQSIGTEFFSLDEAEKAAARVPSLWGKPNLRIQSRTVTDWEDI